MHTPRFSVVYVILRIFSNVAASYILNKTKIQDNIFKNKQKKKLKKLKFKCSKNIKKIIFESWVITSASVN